MWRGGGAPPLFVPHRPGHLHGVAKEKTQQIDQVRPQISMHGGGVERRLAEATTEEFFFDHTMGWDAAIIVVHSQGPARPLSGSHHVLPNRNRVRHYFFAQHMASGFER